MEQKFIFLAAASLLAAAPLLSQTKGVNPISTNSTISTGTTRAVVVGISDYQEKDIPDLRFADKDAEAFANFLRSPAGGSLDKDHLQVLTNQNATAGRVAEALDALIEQAKEGDQVIIYFSGHGDVERKTISQPGFLLCWDSPARVYMGGGTYSLAFLQEIVSTLSTQNKVKVLVVTDACHAGKLAGSQIGGSQITGASLAKQFANEVKILSCQPNEFSLEGEQWGGGRGIFSYHLVDGLFGLADRNGDGQVSVGEIDRYLEDKVTAEAAPQSQVPMLLGNKTERLATVNAAILADFKKGKSSGLPVFTATEGRGLEEEVLSKADSSVRQQYLAFKKAVREKRFFSPENDCAETFYAPLSTEPGLAPLHGFMKRNYAAALQDDAQQTLNEWLKTSQDASLVAGESGSGTRLPVKVFTEKVRSFPRCLDRAAELLGSKHYMYAALKARKCFFEGYLLANSNRNPNPELGKRALEIFRRSLEWQAEQPQVYWQMSLVFGCNFRQSDSLEHYARRAMEVHPNWTRPGTDAGFLLSAIHRRQDRARPFLEQASRIDSNSAEVLNSWACFNFGQKNFAEGEQQLSKAIALDSMNSGFWNNLGYCYHQTRRYAEAEPVLKKAIALDSTYAPAWNNLGYCYHQTRRYAEAEPVLKKAIALDSTYVPAWNNLGALCLQTRRYAEAEPVLKKAMALDSTNAGAWNNFGVFYLNTRRYAEAEPALKKAIALDSTNVTAWNNLGFCYNETRRYAEAELVLKKAIALDSTYVYSWSRLGFCYNQTRRYAEAEPMLKKAIALDSTIVTSWGHLGFAYLQTRRYAEAEPVLKKAISLDSTNASAWNNLGFCYLQTRRYAEAEPIFRRLVKADSTFLAGWNNLGNIYRETNRFEESEKMYRKAFSIDEGFMYTYINYAKLKVKTGDTAAAFSNLEMAFQKGYNDYDRMQSDEDLAPLRALPEWQVLMKKHFPEKVKD